MTTSNPDVPQDGGEDPTHPHGNPIEALLAQQAQEAIAHGKDPKKVSDRLGSMISHLRGNPDVAAQANAALSKGKDPVVVGRRVLDLASQQQFTTDVHDMRGDITSRDAAATPGASASALSGAAQGSTFGLADEILGGIDAANKMIPASVPLMGGQGAPLSKFGENYRSARDKVRDFDTRSSNAHSTAHLTGALAGGLLPVLATGGAGALTSGASVGAKIGNAALQGAGYGAATGVGTAKDLSDVPREALTSGLIGGAGGALVQGALSGGGALARSLGVPNALSRAATRGAEALGDESALGKMLRTYGASTGIAGEANTAINTGLANEGATPDDILAKVRQNVAQSGDRPELIADYSPELLKTTKSVAKQPGAGRSDILQAIRRRETETRGRILQDFTQGARTVAADPEAARAPALPTTLPAAPLAPQRPVDPSPGIRDRVIARLQELTGAGTRDIRGDAEAAVRERASTAAEAFPEAYRSDVVLDDPDTHALLQRPVMRTLFGKAQTSAANRGEALPTVSEKHLTQTAQSLLDGAKPADRTVLEQRLLGIPEMFESVDRPVPNVQTVHYMDRALRDLRQRGFNGESGIGQSDAADAQAILTQLRSSLGAKDPALHEAMQRYATQSRGVDAYETGLNFFKQLTASKPPKGALASGDPQALKVFRTGVAGMEAAVQNMSPEDLPRFRQAAQQVLLERLQSATPTTSGSTANVLETIVADNPTARRWQQLLFTSPEDFAQFRQAVQGERAGVQGYRAATDQYRTDLQGYRAAMTARRGEEKLIGQAQSGNPAAQQTLASRLPGGGQTTLRRIGQNEKIEAINTVPAEMSGSTSGVLRRAFPDSPSAETALQSLFPDNNAFGTFRSALGRERNMAATGGLFKGSDTAENLAEQQAMSKSGILSKLLHPIRALSGAAEAGDEIQNQALRAAIGGRLSQTGQTGIQSVLADAIRASEGRSALSQSQNVFRNALVPQLPFVGAPQ